VDVKKLGPKAALSNLLWLRDAWQKKFGPSLEQNLEPLAKRMSRRQPDDALVSQVNAACTALDDLNAEIKKAGAKLRKVKRTRKVRG
jgi:hypothetical protein